ncbi:MAG TPA: penicillin-binding protein 2 [Gaiellaceae bacterium]|nr:penicillin-binding protein 2 [Gaiellaceae bacterium]
MNAEIRRVAFVGLVLIGALVVGTTYWQAWAAGDLAARQDNAIKSVAQFKIKRGLILAADGTVLAANRRKKVDGQAFYFRRYPQGTLASNIVGYSTQARSRAGLERSLNDYLTGSNGSLRTVLGSKLDALAGKTIVGNNVVLTIDPELQRVAQAALAGNCGAAVALEPSTGRVLAMATSPGYDANEVEHDFRGILRRRGPCSPAARLLNRASSGLYAPGSTFKIVTAAAALDTGKVTPSTVFNDRGYCIEYGKPVYNYDTDSPFGRVTFHQALQYSINSVFCEVGKRLGALEILEYGRRFGMYSEPGLELPGGEQRPSGLYERGRLFFPEQDFQVDPGRLAFGQERLGITPLQMAMVASAIANDGVLMKPYVVELIRSPGGKVVLRHEPKEVGRVMKPSTAHVLTGMMVDVVSAGTGTAGQISGVEVAGKTGTAETGVAGRNTTWFVAFGPAEHARIAVAVALENQTGTGGSTAAPIVREIMTTALRSESAP